jgi:LPPG:FO 2-phospho-L-lactate transferase
VLDAWLVDEADAASVPALVEAGLRARAVPLLMTDVEATAAMAAAAVELARQPPAADAGIRQSPATHPDGP